MRFSVRQIPADTYYEHRLVAPDNLGFPLLGTQIRVQLLQFFGMDEENIIRQDRLYLRKFHENLVLGHFYRLIYPPHGGFQERNIPVFPVDDLFPVPLVHINGVNVIEVFVRPEGVHIGVYSPARADTHFGEFQPFPLRKRMHDLGPAVRQRLYRERHRTFHTVQVIVYAGARQDNHRRSHPQKGKLG